MQQAKHAAGHAAQAEGRPGRASPQGTRNYALESAGGTAPAFCLGGGGAGSNSG